MNLFRKIFNFFFPEKKSKIRSYEITSEGKVIREVPKEEIQKTSIAETTTALEQIFNDGKSKIEIKYQEINKRLFRHQQLPGKIFRTGNKRFRIQKLIGESYDKFNYQITEL